MKNILCARRSCSQISEQRFCYYFNSPGQDGQESQTNETQDAQAEIPNKTEFSVYPRAQAHMKIHGINLNFKDEVITFEKNQSIRMRFDEKTKKVTISSNRGNLLISVEDADGTAITWQTLNGSFIQAVNQKEVPQYVEEGMSKLLTPAFNIYALNNDEELQTALGDLQVSFAQQGIEFGQEGARKIINLTSPPPQHVEVRSDGKGNISFYIFYTSEKKKEGEKDLLFVLSKGGEISKQEFSRPEVQGEKFPLKDLITFAKDRGWMKDEDMVVDSETANLLRQVAKKGYVLSDNNSKTNGFYILKDGKEIGEVTVSFNQDWEKDLRMILKRSLIRKGIA